MKIQYLAVIFIIIVMPLIIVFSEYMNTQMSIIKTEEIYDQKLLNSTYDAIKSFQLNTINSSYYTPETRVQMINSATKIFYNSLITSFNFEGNNSEILKEYVPAIVYTMYDGYYIYAPYTNTWNNVVNAKKVDEKYDDGVMLSGVKPYIPYSCKYHNYDNGKDYIITYSMDNYIVVDIFEGNTHTREQGYLISGITKKGNNSYEYDGCTFTDTENDEEHLKETIINEDGNPKTFEYVLENGSKYYYNNSKDCFFYINNDKEIITQGYGKYNQDRSENTTYKKLMKKLKNNNSAYLYYKNAYEFTKKMLEDEGLKNFTIDNIKKSANYSGYEFKKVENIFGGTIQHLDSNFNQHRADVIRAIITTNLSTAINGFSNYSKALNTEFLMPKISETDWELLENNICIATFLQGLKVGDNTYNNYKVVANNFTKEFVDENDIYILKKDGTYTRANDATLVDNNNVYIEEKNQIGFEPGILKINFEKRQAENGTIYNPICKGPENNLKPYMQSYTSLPGAYSENNISNIDMYRYMEKGIEIMGPKFKDVKKAYYTALGREREGSFKVDK